jgi:probable HAF family extracellular repeat protein
MRPIIASTAATVIFAAIATAQPRYFIVDLGALPGGNFSQANALNQNRLVAGLSTVADGTQHAVLWGGPFHLDIGPAGVNSGAFGINASGTAAVQLELAAKDPNNENFCVYGTGRKCVAARWQQGVMTPLPTLGGNNATVGVVNSRGEISGVAENAVIDPECPPGVSIAGNGPQVLDFQAVVWGPGPNDIRQLHPLPGDTVSVAIGINDSGQAVGSSGRCSNTLLPPIAGGPHAVLWEKDGSVHDLGNLGGTVNTSIPGPQNIGLAINNKGQVTGVAAMPDGVSGHAFLWTRETAAMRDLGTLPGDVTSVGTVINDQGQIVGLSSDAEGNLRACLWQDGTMYDLNKLVIGGAHLHLMFPSGINSTGEISGFGVTATGEMHAFLATPANGASGH